MINISPALPKGSHVKGMQIPFLLTKKSKAMDSPSSIPEGELFQRGEYEKEQLILHVSLWLSGGNGAGRAVLEAVRRYCYR